MTFPLFNSQVSCGLFGIADDFSDRALSLDEKFGRHKAATFFVRAGGDSMAPEIKDQDILIVDRSLPLRSGQIATFFFNDHAICKQYWKSQESPPIVRLRSLNPQYEEIIVKEGDKLELFGVVVGLARDLM